MKNEFTKCALCEREVTEEDIRFFDNTLMCHDCFEKETVTCKDCGKQIWKGGCRGRGYCSVRLLS